MKVKFRTRAAGPWGTNQPGTVGTVPDEVGRALVEGGYAEKLDMRKKENREEKSESQTPETATEPQGETASMEPPRRRRKASAPVSGVQENDQG